MARSIHHSSFIIPRSILILSVVIPAHNEERRLPATLAALGRALAETGIASHEVIVVDDGSIDRTAALAAETGARVVLSGARNIGATRNIGARAATGQYLLFLDADTLPTAAALRAAVEALEAGAAVGGAPLAWDVPVNLFGRVSIRLWNLFSRLTRLPAGGFLFARRDRFLEVGGFDERYFVSEEIWLGLALGRRVRRVIIDRPVTTSSRKLTEHPPSELLQLLPRLLLHPIKTIRDRKALSFWYMRRPGR
jgi:glycosyltransferase involved in cell wall biosynthesis